MEGLAMNEEMDMDEGIDKAELLAGLVGKFGRELGASIYACSALNCAKVEKLEGDMESAIRYTIGTVKRMRVQAMENGRPTTWAYAVERLEMEQVEGRHYTSPNALSRTVARINKINHQEEIDVKRSEQEAVIRELAYKIVQAEEESGEDMVNQIAVRVWIQSYKNALTRTRLGWLSKVIAQIKKGDPVTVRQAKTIGNSYTPEGVKPSEFV